MHLELALGVSMAVLVVAVVLYLGGTRTRLHYTSSLTCPHCGKAFDYKWVPGGSFNAVRLGKERYMRCPLCHRWATFNIWDTRKETPSGSDANVQNSGA